MGVIIGRTQNYYIVGLYDSTMYASVAAEAVERLGESHGLDSLISPL